MKQIPKLSAIVLLAASSIASAQTVLDHAKVIPPQSLSWAAFPESASFTDGIKVVKSDDSDPSVAAYLNVEYAEKSGMPLHVTLLTPWPFSEEAAGKKYPLIVFVQGSAWRKQEVFEVPQLARMVKKGYVVALVEYRPSTVAPFPAQITDIKSAIRFVKKNADKYHIDPSKIVLWGDSSGGHTVLMTAVTLSANQYDDEGQDKDPVSLAAVIDYYGPTDISKMNSELSTQDHIAEKSPEGLLLGGVNVLSNPDKVKPTVPMNYLNPAWRLPPILIAHGSKDRLVPFGQSVMMFDALKKTKQETEMYQLKGADHGGAAFWSAPMLEVVDDFIKRHI